MRVEEGEGGRGGEKERGRGQRSERGRGEEDNIPKWLANEGDTSIALHVWINNNKTHIRLVC